MMTLRPGSQAFLLVSLLAVTGEFPLRSLHLLGNERVLRELVRSGVEIRPYLLPVLQTESIRQTVTGGRHTFYFARDLKKLRAGEQNKTMFTRTVGALFSTGSCYAVYNTRASAMKWSGLGEFKALHSLNELARMNAGVGMDSAILFGASEEMALATLAASAHPNRPGLQRSIWAHSPPCEQLP